jgi:subtilisin family serine protease
VRPSDQPTFGRPTTTRQPLETVPGQLVVRFHEDAVRPHLPAERLAFTATSAQRLPEPVVEPLEHLRRNLGLRSVEPLFSPRRAEVGRARVAGADRARLAVLSSVADTESEDLAGTLVVHLPAKNVTASTIRQVASAKVVDFVEQLPVRWLTAVPTPDPGQNLQWGLRAIGWFDATIPDAGDVTVGVLDTGIDTGHPDLRGVDVTYDHPGFSARDLAGHGTHVSGIIAATTNNGVGISGVSACRLHVWKIFGDDTSGGPDQYFVDSTSYYRALNAARTAGVRAVNLSIGGTFKAQLEGQLIQRLQQAGVVVCAAMGNEFEEGNPTEYPGAWDGVVSVGASTELAVRAPFSNTGRHIDLVAPGANIVSTLPRRRSPILDETNYASWSGTSMATPHVSACVALLAAKRPTSTGDQIKGRLTGTTKRLGAMGSQARTSEYGSGLLDLKRALS